MIYCVNYPFQKLDFSLQKLDEWLQKLRFWPSKTPILIRNIQQTKLNTYFFQRDDTRLSPTGNKNLIIRWRNRPKKWKKSDNIGHFWPFLDICGHLRTSSYKIGHCQFSRYYLCSTKFMNTKRSLTCWNLKNLPSSHAKRLFETLSPVSLTFLFQITYRDCIITDVATKMLIITKYRKFEANGQVSEAKHRVFEERRDLRWGVGYKK